MKHLTILVPPKPEFDNTVQGILRRAEYRHLSNKLQDFLDSVKRAVSDWLIELLRRIGSGTPKTPVISDRLSTVFVIIGLLVILAIIILIIVNVSKSFDKKTRVREILGERIDEKTTTAGLRGKAAAFYREGDLRQAIRYDFIALLLLMHEKSLLYLDESKTNQEIYQHLKKNGFSNLQAFEHLIDTYNTTWYGHRQCDRDRYDMWSSRLGLLWNEVIHVENKGK